MLNKKILNFHIPLQKPISALDVYKIQFFKKKYLFSGFQSKLLNKIELFL